MQEEEYIEIHRYLFEKVREAELHDLADHIFLETGQDNLPGRYQLIHVLETLRVEIALADNATLRQTIRRLRANVRTDIVGVQVALSEREQQLIGRDVIDLGSSAELQELLQQLDDLRAALETDSEEG